MMDEHLKYLSILNMIKKYYELTRWERVRHWDEVLTFHRMDWSYALWTNNKWDPVIWHYDSYELWDDGIYEIVEKK